MTTNTPHDIETSTAARPLPAQPVVPHPHSDIPFTPIETAFLRLFGHVDLFGGIAPALAEVADALNAAHHVYGTQRYAQWAEGGTSFGQRIDAMEAWGRPELGLPSTEEEKPTPGDMLSRLEDSSLETNELLKVRALFGARIASALSKDEPLPRSAIENQESLLICNRNRSRQHEDWRTVIGHAKIDEDGLRELKLSLKSAVARDFIDDVLLALGSAIADPNAAAINATSAGDTAESTT